MKFLSNVKRNGEFCFCSLLIKSELYAAAPMRTLIISKKGCVNLYGIFR